MTDAPGIVEWRRGTAGGGDPDDCCFRVAVSFEQERKKLVYTVLSKSRVLRVREDVRPRVRVLVDDIPVQDLGLVHVRIRNAGSEPLKATDFVLPISVAVTQQRRIVDAEVVERKPPELDAELEKGDQQIESAIRSLIVRASFPFSNVGLRTDYPGRNGLLC